MVKYVSGLAGLLILGAILVGLSLVFRPTARFAPPCRVTIPRGASLTTVARTLARRGIIRSELGFVVYTEMKGAASRILPGVYSFGGREAAPAVLQHLIRGDFLVVTVTIPEGLTVHQIGALLERHGLVCDHLFDAAARDGTLVRSLGLAPPGAEGFLFPATYRFPPDASRDAVLRAMLSRSFQLLTPQVEERLFALGLSAREMLTLASIVEKEAKIAGERPLIAGVFYNRLRLGMPLQSDPTAQYSFNGEIVRAAAAVHTASAYNTYDFSGLPPGPIANPGFSSIHAVLYPTTTDYLYFVARADGSHIFSRTLREHNIAIAQLRKQTPSSIGTARPANRSQ